MAGDPWASRIARYQYLESLLCDRSVLEFGCGTGYAARRLADLAAQVVAVDPAQHNVKQAQAELQKASGSPKNLVFMTAAPDRIKQPDSAFDVAIVPELHRWVAAVGLVDELRRVLRPHGLLVLSCTSADAGEPSGLSYDDLIDYIGDALPHYRVFGEIPFVGQIIADFHPTQELEPELDCSLVQEDEAPAAYLAIASRDPVLEVPYTVLQLPLSMTELSSGYAAEGVQLERQLVQERSRADQWEERAAVLEARLLVTENMASSEVLDTAPHGDSAIPPVGAQGLIDVGHEERLKRANQRADQVQRRHDQLVRQLEDEAAERSHLRRRLAEQRSLRQTDQWTIDQLEGRIREVEARQSLVDESPRPGSSSEELQIAAQQRQLDALLKGAALHEQQAQMLENEVSELRTQNAALRKTERELQTQLKSCREEHAALRESLSHARRDAAEVGRRLSVAEGRLKRTP